MCSRSTRWLLLCALAFTLLRPGPAQAACAGRSASVRPDDLREARHAVRCLVNDIRARHGLRRLSGSATLRRAATRHSRDMVRGRFFGHVSLTGADLAARLRASGYLRPGLTWIVGETIGWGRGRPATPGGIVRQWMHSPPHREILLSGSFRQLGLGVAIGSPLGGAGVTYTADLGSRGH